MSAPCQGIQRSHCDFPPQTPPHIPPFLMPRPASGRWARGVRLHASSPASTPRSAPRPFWSRGRGALVATFLATFSAPGLCRTICTPSSTAADLRESGSGTWKLLYIPVLTFGDYVRGLLPPALRPLASGGGFVVAFLIAHFCFPQNRLWSLWKPWALEVCMLAGIAVVLLGLLEVLLLYRLKNLGISMPLWINDSRPPLFT